MKTRFITLVLSLLACLNVWSRHDGAYMNGIGDELISAHLDWGLQSQKPLRVLFLTTRDGARDLVELSQRLPLEREVFVSQNRTSISRNSPYEAALTGTTQYEKEAELRALVQKQYQLIVFGGVALKALPYDVQCYLLQQVREGAGLVSINQPLPYKKLVSQQLERPAFLAESQLPPGILSQGLQVAKFGAGRILTYKVESTNYSLPDYTMDSTWQANYENAQLFLIRALRWAAKCDYMLEWQSQPIKADTGIVLIDTDPNIDVQCRLRNEYNQILATLPLLQGRASLPPLPNGRYFADFIGSDGNIAVQTFELETDLGELQLQTLPGDSFEAETAIPVQLSWSQAQPEALGLTVELIGLPHQQCWYRQEFPVGSIAAGARSWEFTLKDYSVPTLAAELAVQWRDSAGRPLAQKRHTIFFPKREFPDYFQLGWDIPRNPLYAHQLVDGLGFSMGLTHPSPQVVRKASLLNCQFVPYLTRILIGRGENGEVTQRMLHQLNSKELQTEYEALGPDQSFARPEVRELIKKHVAFRMQDLPKYGPPLYSLGDENGNNTRSGYGASDLEGFRNFVQNKYQKIENLNREWRSQYQDFSTVPHPPLEEALAAKNFAAWNDHLEYMERMYADIHHFYASEIRKLDPRARVGLEGTFGGDNFEQMMEKLDWWGPYSNLVEDEVLRSFYPQVPRFLWAGYHRERGEGKYPLLTNFLLRGSVNGNGWYSTYVQDVHSILSLDYTPSFPEPFMAELQRLRFGLAQLLVNNPLQSSGLVVYWSHLSRRGDKVDPRCVNPESGIAPLLRFCYRSGLSLEFASSRTLERLESNKVLMLLGISSLSATEAEAILSFVQKGGVVIADINPAVLNEYMNIRSVNPLRELFGNLVLDATRPALELRPLEVRCPDQSLFKADKALQDPSLPCLVSKKYGAGQAVLLNFNFAVVETSADPQMSLDVFLHKLLQHYGVTVPYQQDSDVTFRVRQGAGFELLGIRGSNEQVNASELVHLQLPESRFVYECGQGFYGQTDRIATRFQQRSLYLYSCFREKQNPPSVKLPSHAPRGTRLPLDFSHLPSGRVLSLKLTAPNGQELLDRHLVLDTARKKQAELLFAWTDTSGTYQLQLMDVSTGLQQTYQLQLD